MKHEAEFKPRSRCKAPASASSNLILILLTGFAQQLPSEKLALQPEWSFPVPKWSWHSQSPLPAFQRLPIARKIRTPRNPEAPWSNLSSFAQLTGQRNWKVRVWSRETFIPGLPWWLSGKESTCSTRDANVGSIPGSGRSPGGGHGNPLQYSTWWILMDRGAWWVIVTKSQTQLRQLNTHKCKVYCKGHTSPQGRTEVDTTEAT